MEISINDLGGIESFYIGFTEPELGDPEETELELPYCPFREECYEGHDLNNCIECNNPR